MFKCKIMSGLLLPAAEVVLFMCAFTVNMRAVQVESGTFSN